MVSGEGIVRVRGVGGNGGKVVNVWVRSSAGEVWTEVGTSGTNLKTIDVNNARQNSLVRGIKKKLAPISNLKMFTIQRKESWWYAPHTLFVAHHYIRCISNHCYSPQRRLARDFDQNTTKRRFSLAL